MAPASPGGSCHGEEVEEHVEAEDGEYEAQQDAGDEGGDLHGQTLLMKRVTATF